MSNLRESNERCERYGQCRNCYSNGMLLRLSALAAVYISALIAGSSSPAPSMVGTISSSEPIMINGSGMSPSASPSWPVAGKDEISVSAAAVFRSKGKDILTFDPHSRAKIDSAQNGRAYVYIREGGVYFNA